MDYSIRYHILMAKSGWNDVVLLISLVTRLDSRSQARHQQKVREFPVRSLGNVSRQSRTPMEPSIPVPVRFQEVLTNEPMHLGRTQLTLSERKHQLSTRVYLYCGLAGLFLADCTVQPKD